MRKLFLLLSILCTTSCIPPESANRHYTIGVMNKSEKGFYISFDRHYFGRPPSDGVVNYYNLKFERPGDTAPADYLVLPGEINRRALDIGSKYGGNTVEGDMALCNWIIHFLDAEVVDSTPFEELIGTHKGVIFQKEYSLQDIRLLNFLISYPEED